MKRKLNKLIKNKTGFTLLEVLVAAVIAGFVIAAGFEVFITQNKNHQVQDSISEMQLNGRKAVDELIGSIRQAGYRLPEGVPALLSWNSNPDTIAIMFVSEPICTASLSDPMTMPSSELECTGSDISCFSVDTWAYIYDPVVDSGEFFYISDIQEAVGQIQHNTSPLSKNYTPPTDIYVMDFYKYYVDFSDTLQPVLMVEINGSAPEPYADNIEDMQFIYFMADGSILDTITVDRYVREIGISVRARTHKHDLFVENDYRRENFTTKVQVRNLALK